MAAVELDRLVRRWLADDTESELLEPPSTALLDLAREQRLSSILYDLANRQSKPVTTPSPSNAAIEALTGATRPQFYRTLLVNQGLLANADRVVAILHQRGIDAVRLKGADLLLDTYTSPGLRPMDDIDLLVAPSDRQAALDALFAAGYVLPPASLPVDFYLEHHFHLAVIAPGAGAYIEIHWELMDLFRRGALDADSVIANARLVDPVRPELGKRLDPVTRFLYLALHIDKHGPFHEILLRRTDAWTALLHGSSEARLIWFIDLALTLRDPNLHLEKVFSLARSVGVERALATTLEMSSGLLGGPDVSAMPPVGEDGAVGRFAADCTARLLLGEGRLNRRILSWAVRMDKGAQVRPLRLFELVVGLFGFRQAAGDGGVSFIARLRQKLAHAWRAIRLAGALVRYRLAGVGGGG